MTPLQLVLTFGLCVSSFGAWMRIFSPRGEDPAGLFPRVFPEPPPLPRSVVGMALVSLGLFLLGPLQELVHALLGTGSSEREMTLGGVQSACAFDLLLTAALWAALVGSRADLRACGLRWDEPARDAADAVLGFRLAIGPVFVVLFLSAGIGLRTEEPEHEFLRLLTVEGSLVNWLWISATAVIAAPLAEELVFRVLVQGWLEGKLPPPAAIGCSSVLFCTVHPFPDSLGLIPLALVLGWVQSRRRSYLAVVLIHALFNAVNLLLTALDHAGPPPSS
jgi:membrane protease YdiL (CAAX protease family)